LFSWYVCGHFNSEIAGCDVMEIPIHCVTSFEILEEFGVCGGWGTSWKCAVVGLFLH
jgi:hypothetical protein